MKKYVLITGGQLENKGAQAMTFLVVTKMKEFFPNSEIVLFSDFDSNRAKEELENYNFAVKRFPGWKNLIKWKMGFRDSVGKRYIELFSNSICIIDISGYRLGSYWGTGTSIQFCKTLAYAKMFKTPAFIMPQSFGPFDYTGKKAVITNFMIRHYLPYAKIIMARENEGKHLLETKYNLKNVVKTSDMIIQSTEAKPELVYKKMPVIREIDVDHPSVAIVPNEKNSRNGLNEKTLLLYKDIIQYILDHGKRVYLIYHSVADIQLCHDLKSVFQEDERVILIDDELSCFEYSSNISKFDYIIGSRFHSIVHAYKKGVPALVIGWAIKYHDLTSDFDQERYCVDIQHLNLESIISKLEHLNNYYKEESEVIQKRLAELQKEDVFDYIAKYAKTSKDII